MKSSAVMASLLARNTAKIPSARTAKESRAWRTAERRVVVLLRTKELISKACEREPVATYVFLAYSGEVRHNWDLELVEQLRAADSRALQDLRSAESARGDNDELAPVA